MTHNTIRVRVVQLVLAAALGGAPVLQAQQSCDTTVTRAFNEFETGRRVQLLMIAVDPATCPPGPGVWSVGVQLLAQTLMEDGRDSLAAVWLRWAVRLAPQVQPDTVQFLPRVIAAHRAARDFVFRSGSRADSAAITSWQWPPRMTGESIGRLQVNTPGAGDGVRVFAEGGMISSGASIPLAPGSYAVSVSAAGYDSVRVTREVLPGVTTLLAVRIRPSVVALQPPPPPAVQTRKKKSPVLWIVAGVAAAGAVALVAGGGGGGNGPTTGGITLTFPNP